MVPTDFAKLLTGFLTGYLPHERGISKNTLRAYKDTFILLINYMAANGIKAENLSLEQINRDSINGFLDWLQAERSAGNATRNARLAAIRSFYRYVQYEAPERIYEAQRIHSIKAKRTEKPTIEYQSVFSVLIRVISVPVTTIKFLLNPCHPFILP